MTQEHPPEACPICGGPLHVDEEYMLDTFGSTYTALPWRDWSFYCEGDCEEAGLWTEFERIAHERSISVTTNDQDTTTFEGWAILELMGHRRLIGRLSTATIAGASFLRIDIPREEGAETTQFYSPSAVYAITPTTEELARRAAHLNTVAPVSRFELPAPKVPEMVADAAIGYGQDDDDLHEDEDDLSGGDEAEIEAAKESWR